MASPGDFPLINNYSLCNQSVTVYHYDNGEITRTEYEKAYFEATEKQELDQRGESGKTEHLIVIPGNTRDFYEGDKVYLGIGEYPEGDAARWWRNFIPAKNRDVVVIRSVSFRRWQNAVVHVEMRG